ncbi:MAG: hypothetical protein QOF02_3201 [Blastocatellia bacterium]|nr:hypothetical protein [Blastocatellia bacterium]
MPIRFHGQQRDNIIDRLVNKWMPGGPTVAILQGFPGCGKSQLALAVATKALRSLDPEEPPMDSADPVVDLFLNLALALEARGLPALEQELNKGDKAKPDKALLNLLRREQILIVVDEFQRLFPKDKSTPPPAWAKLVEDLNNSRAQGRLLLISNRFIKTERWSENCHVEELHGLPDQEAESLFTELLESQGLDAAVPTGRRREIVHRLGGNPRALKTLVIGLRTDTLDDLLSTAPDLLEPGDVALDPKLVEDFEREVLERALPRFEADLLKFMRWLSVHRRPFKKEALAQFTGGRESPEALRKQLFDRFLLERTAGGDIPHPLAREISVTRLRTEGREWAQAHNLAANYYFRYFKARQLTGTSNLAASYTELRHHLYEAGRIGELYEASEKLTQYAISQIGLNTPVPTHKELVEERIALLSALPNDQRPKVLEYHLARCYLKRGEVGDKERALKHARRGTGRHPHAAPWILRLDLEYELNGFYTALPVISEALRNIKADEDASSIYQRGAEMMAKDNRLDDAITLLEKGIAVIPADKNLFSLYQSAIELTGKAGNYSKAEAFAVKGLTAIPKASGRHRIAETALRVFSVRRDTEAIERLLSGTGPRQLDPPQRTFANYILDRLSGDWAKAAEVAHKGYADFPSYTYLCICACEARLALGQAQEAYGLMMSYQPGERQVRDNPSIWFKAYVCLITGRPDEAKTLAAMYAPNDFDAGCPLDEVEMLRLWSVARNGLNVSVEDNYPGLAEYRRRIATQTQTAEKAPAAQISERMCLLLVATEWDSRHGGLSTFNRDLCAALADSGARVVCYVPEASAEEKQRASRVNVEIVEAREMPGTKGKALLVHPPVLPAEFVPDVVIGHDRITGAASVALVKYHYSGSKRVLFIHTSPEEIEWHKDPREDSTSAARAAERKREQLGLAEGCGLIVAVGPHLAAEFGTDLHGAGNPAPVMELTPGLPECFNNVEAQIPPTIRCLILGRVEDYQLKGLDLAAKAFSRVVANWKQGNPPKLVVRGAPVGTDAVLKQRLANDSAPTELDIVIRYYSANETEIRNDLREASLVLMPSRKEGFGLVGLEAIACGIPTLISAQSGLAEIVERHASQLAGEWVLPVTADSFTKWAERIELLIMGREGAFARAAVLRKKLAEELDWKRAAAELLSRLAKVRQT